MLRGLHIAPLSVSMAIISLICGIALVTGAVLDAFWTTFWTEGVAGPLSSRMLQLLWRMWRAIVPKASHRALTLAGPFILFSIVAMWAVMIWLGWGLIFAADPASLISTTTQTYPDFVGRLYFAAMAVFTMGNGDFTPQGNRWQIATALANASGFLVLTLVLSYVLSVLSAEVEKRALAKTVTGIGETGYDFVLSGWNGKDFHDLDLALNSISTRLGELAEQHLAYPILHYFLPAQQKASPIVAIAILEDAVLLLSHGVEQSCRPNMVCLKTTRSALDGFAENVRAVASRIEDAAAPTPSLANLSRHNIPVNGEEELHSALAERSQTRNYLAGNLRDNGWDWPA